MKTVSVGTLCIVGLMLGCSSSRITSTWKTPESVTTNYRKIMVVGFINEADRSVRERMEAHVLGDLKSLGYTVSSAYETYGPKGLTGLTEEQVNERLGKDGIDAVATVVLLDKQKERSYIPGREVNVNGTSYRNHFYQYYRELESRVGHPGYYAESTRYFWESNFYDLRNKKLVFSVQTQSFDPTSANAMAHEYGKLIVESMIKHGAVAKQNETTAASGLQ